MKPSKPWLADFIFLASIWGGSFLFMHLAVGEFGALPTAAVRVAIGALFLMPFLWWHQLWPELAKNWKPIFFVGIFNAAVPFACYCFALQYVTTGVSAILNATVPLFGALVAFLWLKDRLTSSRILGLAVGFLGVALLAWDRVGAGFQNHTAAGLQPALAIGACLLATLCYGIAASFTKRYLGGISSLVTAAGSHMGATLLLAGPALWLRPAHMPSSQAWLAVLAVGVVCSGIAYILFFRLIENAGPTRTLTVTFVVPVFAVTYGVALLGEHITSRMVLYAAIIVLGTSLSTGILKLRRPT